MSIRIRRKDLDPSEVETLDQLSALARTLGDSWFSRPGYTFGGVGEGC